MRHILRRFDRDALSRPRRHRAEKRMQQLKAKFHDVLRQPAAPRGFNCAAYVPNKIPLPLARSRLVLTAVAT